MVDSPPRRRRPRRGSLERPISARLYRAVWTAVLIPVLVAAFTVGQPDPLPAPVLPASFDQETAVQYAIELAQQFPDRSAGSPGALKAAAWVATGFGELGLVTHRHVFSVEVAGLGRKTLVNLFAVVPGTSSQAIAVMADRDNLGFSPGANDNASGTAALLELARNVVAPEEGRQTSLAHTLVFVSTDGGAYGALGAAELARRPEPVTRVLGSGGSIVAVVNLDAIAGAGPARLEFAGDVPRSPAVSLLASAEASIRAQTGSRPSMPSPFGQLIDLAFPFTLLGQGPLLAHGIPALTVTTGDSRPPSPYHDTVPALRRRQLGTIGRAAQALLASLDEAPDIVRGTDSYVFIGSRQVHGWAIKFVLLAALAPFLVATVDLFARCRRRRIRLLPALRSLRSRLGVWLWIGGLFALLAVTGVFPDGTARPISPDTPAAGDWPAAALLALSGLAAVGWLVARPRLVPAGEVDRADELGGHLAAMLALAIVALLVTATNPYALIFVLPSLHVWLWLPHLAGLALRARFAAYALGFAGPALLVLSFAVRFDLGLDAFWYLLALTALDYVPLPLVIAFLVWAAAAAQVGAIAVGRYAPYPRPSQRPRRGPIRETIRQLVLLARRRRRVYTNGR